MLYLITRTSCDTHEITVSDSKEEVLESLMDVTPPHKNAELRVVEDEGQFLGGFFMELSEEELLEFTKTQNIVMLYNKDFNLHWIEIYDYYRE